MTLVGTIKEIRRFPVKSMQGELLSEAALTSLGISGDRAFAVRDLKTRKILSAKTPKVGTKLLACRAQSIDGQIVVVVNDKQFDVRSAELHAVLSSLLERDVAVEPASDADEVYETYWPEMQDMALSDVTIDLPIAMSTEKGTFADLAALHLLADSSVDYIRSMNPSLSLDMNRFRPSIAIASQVHGDLVEKGWVKRTAKLGEASITFGEESPRCIMTTLPQAGHLRQPEVLQTIANANRTEFGGFGNFACLGIYAEVTSPGRIAVGDNLQLKIEP